MRTSALSLLALTVLVGGCDLSDVKRAPHLRAPLPDVTILSDEPQRVVDLDAYLDAGDADAIEAFVDTTRLQVRTEPGGLTLVPLREGYSRVILHLSLDGQLALADTFVAEMQRLPTAGIAVRGGVAHQIELLDHAFEVGGDTFEVAGHDDMRQVEIDGTALRVIPSQYDGRVDVRHLRPGMQPVLIEFSFAVTRTSGAM